VKNQAKYDWKQHKIITSSIWMFLFFKHLRLQKLPILVLVFLKFKLIVYFFVKYHQLLILADWNILASDHSNCLRHFLKIWSFFLLRIFLDILRFLVFLYFILLIIFYIFIKSIYFIERSCLRSFNFHVCFPIMTVPVILSHRMFFEYISYTLLSDFIKIFVFWFYVGSHRVIIIVVTLLHPCVIWG